LVSHRVIARLAGTETRFGFFATASLYLQPPERQRSSYLELTCHLECASAIEFLLYWPEGPAKTKSTDPPVHLLNLRPTNHHPTFFFLDFFFSKFLGVSRQGEFKNTITIFLQKVHVENKIQNFDNNFDVSFSSTFFVLSRFRVFFSDGSSKTLQKTFYKKIVSKSFYKKNDQKSKTDFFSIFLITFLGVSRGGEFKNTITNIGKKI
jgi:hypothetical protein